MKNTSLFLLQNASTLTLQHPHLASLFFWPSLFPYTKYFFAFLAAQQTGFYKPTSLM